MCSMPITQPIPQVTADDVERVVRRDFPADDYATVIKILNDYGTENWHRERIRVQLAALKLANANVEKLRACIEAAKRDYRDALVAAEYPAYHGIAWTREFRDTSNEEKARIIESDWRQYEEWLKKVV